jgi:hypothetical protein
MFHSKLSAAEPFSLKQNTPLKNQYHGDVREKLTFGWFAMSIRISYDTTEDA